MRKSRFSEEQKVKMVREAEHGRVDVPPADGVRSSAGRFMSARMRASERRSLVAS